MSHISPADVRSLAILQRMEGKLKQNATRFSHDRHPHKRWGGPHGPRPTPPPARSRFARD
jgi:hypothetical protein